MVPLFGIYSYSLSLKFFLLVNLFWSSLSCSMIVNLACYIKL